LSRLSPRIRHTTALIFAATPSTTFLPATTARTVAPPDYSLLSPRGLRAPSRATCPFPALHVRRVPLALVWAFACTSRYTYHFALLGGRGLYAALTRGVAYLRGSGADPHGSPFCLWFAPAARALRGFSVARCMGPRLGGRIPCHHLAAVQFAWMNIRILPHSSAPETCYLTTVKQRYASEPPRALAVCWLFLFTACAVLLPCLVLHHHLTMSASMPACRR